MSKLADVIQDDSFQKAAKTGLEPVTPAQPTEVRQLGRGNRKVSTLVSYEQQEPVVVQLCEERTWLQTEATLLAHIRKQTAVPVPPVLASGVTDGVAYMVTAHVSGDDLHETFSGFDTGAKQQLARAFGSHLASLHKQFRFDNYGALVVDGNSLQAWQENWTDWFTEYGQNAVERLPSQFDSIRQALLALFDSYSSEEPPTARLYPWDFRPGNALVDDGRLTAILDWEAPIAAAPALSAAKVEYLVADWYVDTPKPLRQAFIEGYEQVRSYPAIEDIHRVAAIADSAVDSNGTVTNPKYPELAVEESVAFHRNALQDLL
ncbi:phosphotransferase family protein [Halovenus rubra]|uniref:Phosphotransferase family protein n=2 Tax=Halovenus rubra TaxID=869890 RepID=A0ABD5XA46_9EURY|nr:phosphotransferase [Halovenus rubra]